jgi:2-polyprenyl-6-methoxyphenol hydroxylase-like FAD-dependent oxidoreductase
MEADFLIVGGGIGGGVLAELLGRAGKKVVLLEKALAPRNWVRPEILWPATVEILFSLLPRRTWEENALLCLGGIEVRDGSGTIRSLSPEVFQKIQVERWAADANETRETLLRLGSFELRRGVEVIGVLKEEDRVIGVRTREVASCREAEILAPWTIGDDGAYSLVRQACGLELKTRLFPIDFLCFGFSCPPAFEKTTTKIWVNLGKSDGILALLAVPLPQGRGAGVILVRPETFEREEEQKEVWRRFCVLDPSLRQVVGERTFPSDFARVRRHWGHAARYGIKGAILMGDAAHPVSPAGGQGANMSVADAHALAQVSLDNSSSLLEEYERRRRKANARSLRFTRLAARALDLPTWGLPSSFFLSVAHWVAQQPSLVRPLVRYVSTAFQEK